MSDSLRPHGLQHTRLHHLSPTPGVYPNACPLSRWCHPTISFSVLPFSSCLQSFPASGTFPMSRFFASGGQSIGASATVLPMNIQGWFPLRLTSLISLLSKGLSRVFSSTTIQKRHSSMLSLFYGPTLTSIRDYWKNPQLWLYKPLWERVKDREALHSAVHGVSQSWTQTFVGKGMSLLFNMLSRFVITFLPRSKCLWIPWLQSWNLEWLWCPRK